MPEAFASLEEVISDDRFPEVDLALRRGRHIGREDGTLYEYLSDALEILEPFYRRFGCELVQRSDGYCYLLPSGDRLGRRHLSAGEMLVGQALALMYLDPASLASGRVIDRSSLLYRLEGLLGQEALQRILLPRRRKFDERIAADAIRQQVGEASRKLAELGFVDALDEGKLRLRPALMRFAEPVRALADPAVALSRLIAVGEMVLGGEDDPVAEGGDSSS